MCRTYLTRKKWEHSILFSCYYFIASNAENTEIKEWVFIKIFLNKFLFHSASLYFKIFQKTDSLIGGNLPCKMDDLAACEHMGTGVQKTSI